VTNATNEDQLVACRRLEAGRWTLRRFKHLNVGDIVRIDNGKPARVTQKPRRLPNGTWEVQIETDYEEIE
jgi:hypothetical protein